MSLELVIKTLNLKPVKLKHRWHKNVYLIDFSVKIIKGLNLPSLRLNLLSYKVDQSLMAGYVYKVAIQVV